MNRGRRNAQPQRRSWQEESFEDEHYYDNEPEEEEPWREPVEEIIATNRMVLLTCTLAAMLPPFALFLIFAEKRSRAIRHYALQSTALSVCHIAVGAVLLMVNALLGGIPFFGFLLNLVLWIVYIVALLLMIILRLRMMFFAWRGAKFVLPLVGNGLQRFC